MKKSLFITICVLCLVGLTVAMANSSSLFLIVQAKKDKIKNLDEFKIVYTLVNSEVGTHPVIFYAPIPTHTTFITVENGQPITYTLPLEREGAEGLTGRPFTETVQIPPEDVRAIIWTGELDARTEITLTVKPERITRIVAHAKLVDDETHVTALVTQDEIEAEIDYYFPLVLRGGRKPTPTPEPTPPPVREQQIPLLRQLFLESMGEGHEAVLAGTAGSLSAQLHAPPYLRLDEGNVIPGREFYFLVRQSQTLDTRAIALSQVASVTLEYVVSEVDIDAPSDQTDYNVIIEKTNFDYLQLNFDQDINAPLPIEGWRNQTPQPTVEISAFSETYPFTQVVELPSSLFEWGGLTQLRYRFKREATKPPASPGLGEGILLSRWIFIVHLH